MFNRLTAIASIFGLTLAVAAPLVMSNFAKASTVVLNNSFETHSGTQGFTPTFGTISIGSWTTGVSAGGANPPVTGAYEGISINLVGMTPAPDGTVAAFIEGLGTFSQSVSGFDSGPLYTVSFYAERYSGGAEALQLLIDSTPLTFNSGAASTQTPGSSTSFTQYTTDPFTVTTGSHTLTFNGTVADGAGHISFVDLVTVDELPEPASLGLLTLGCVTLLRRRRYVGRGI